MNKKTASEQTISRLLSSGFCCKTLFRLVAGLADALGPVAGNSQIVLVAAIKQATALAMLPPNGSPFPTSPALLSSSAHEGRGADVVAEVKFPLGYAEFMRAADRAALSAKHENPKLRTGD